RVGCVRSAANRGNEREPPHHRRGAQRGERGGADQMKKLTAGFIPLLDCAPIVAAVEQGFAAAEGLELKLVRETSWANIRDRLIVGHFDVAHMLGPMAVASTLGVGHLRAPMIAPFALGSGGNAITVSLPLWEQMTSEGAS